MTNEHNEQSEDITQDPEYIKGYEEGMKRYRGWNGPWGKGLDAGFTAAKEASEAVESEAVPSTPKQDEQSEQSPETANPFIAMYQRRVFAATQLGLEPPQNLGARDILMQDHAHRRILNGHITDEAGKIKVYEETKAQFKEYEDYLRSQGVPRAATQDPGTPNEHYEDITQDPEYIKGYEQGIAAWRSQHSVEMRGFHAGLHALETPKTVESKAMPGSSKQEDYVTRKEFEEFKADCERRWSALEAIIKI